MNDQGALPQFATVTFVVVLLPTSSLPNRSVCWLAQKRPWAAAPHALEKSASAMRKRFVARSPGAAPSGCPPQSFSQFSENRAHLLDRPVDFFFGDCERRR
ncbi:MAG TPA: hypothetical protein VGW79_02285, partial [Actinomycetota bacterium]|nr:hypothetical protein [Actinomycetota bacterium]